MPQVNLLPPELRVRRRERRILLIVGGVALVILVFLGVVLILQRGRISDEQDELDRLEAQASQLRARAAELQRFGELKANVDRTRQTLQAALTNDVAWSRFLNDLSIILPDNSWLVNVSLSAAPGTAPNGRESFGTTTFQGFVFDFPGLAGWLTRMGQMDGLTFVYLTTGSRQELGDQEVVSFGANANVTDAMLSRRCQEGRPCP